MIQGNLGGFKLAAGRESGVVLLLVMMVIAVLIVLVGQFSYSALLDRKAARNYLDSAQTMLDVASAAEAACEYLDRHAAPLKEPEEMTFNLAGAEIKLELHDEQGKFNVNSVKTPPPGVSAEEAALVFEAVLKNADKPAGTLDSGLDDSVIALVKESPMPILTMGMLSDGGGTGDLGLAPDGGSASPDPAYAGLASFLTVWTDGKINPASAPDAVLLAITGLEDDLRGSRAGQLRDKLLNPGANVPSQVSEAAARAGKWMKDGSDVYSAFISTDRNGFRKQAQAVFRKGASGKFETVLVNEME